MLNLLPRHLLGCATSIFGVAAAALVGLAGVGVWSGTGGGERFIERQVERLVTKATVGGRLDIGGIDLGRGGLRVDDVVLFDASDKVVFSAGRLIAELDGWSLLKGVIHVPHVRAEAVSVDLVADEHGVLNLSRLFGGPSDKPVDPNAKPFEFPLTVRVPDIQLRGVNVRYDTSTVVTAGTWPVQKTAVELAGLDGHASFEGKGDRMTVSDLMLAAQVAVPGPLSVRAHGGLVYDGSDGILLDNVVVEVPHGSATANGTIGEVTDLGVKVDRLEMRALDPIAGDAGLGGVWTATLKATGTDDVYDLVANLQGLDATQGRVAITGTVDQSDPVPTWRVAAALQTFHVEQIYTALAQPIVLGGTITAEGRGTSPANDLELTGRWQGGPQSIYGQDIDTIDTRFAMKEGVLSILDGYVDGIVGALRLDGTVDLLRGPVSVTATGTLSPERLAKLGAKGLDGNGTILANVALDLKADPIVVVVDGAAQYAPFLYPNVKMNQLSAPFHVSVENGIVDGTIGLYGQGVDASGLTVASLETGSLRLGVDTATQRTTVTGPIHLGGIAYDQFLTAEQGDVDLRVLMAGGHMAVDADLAIGAHTLVGQPATDGLVGIQLRDDALAFDVKMADFGRSVLDTNGTFDLGSSDIVLESVAFAPTPRTTWTTARPGRMTLADGGVTNTDLLLRSDLGELEVKGTLGTKGTLDGTVAVRSFQIDHLAEMYPDTFDGLSGSLDLSLALGGDASDPTVDGNVDLRGLYVAGGIRWFDVAGTVRLANHALVPDLRLGVAGNQLGVVSGAIPLSGGLANIAVDYDAPIDLSLAVTPGGFDRLVLASPSLDGQELPVGRFSAVVEVSDTMRDPMLRLAGVAEMAVDGWNEPGRAEFDVTRRANDLDFHADLRQGLVTRGLVTGTGATRLGEAIAYLVDGTGEAPVWGDLQMYLDDMTVSTALVGMPVASLASAASSTVPLTGELVGGVTVTGSPMRPTVEGAFNWLNATVDGQAMDSAYLAIAPKDQGYDLDLSLSFAEGGGFDVKGGIPVVVDLDREWSEWSTGELALDVTGTGIPVSMLSAVVPDLRGGEGYLAISGKVGGTIADPAPEILATGKAGQLEYADLGITAEDIDFELAVDAKRVRLDHLDFVPVPSYGFQASRITQGDERPRVHIAGSANLEEWQPTALSARVELTDGAWLAATESMTLRANGDVQISGAWPALSVTGDVDVVNGRIVLDAAALASAAPLEPDASLHIVRGDLGPPPPEAIVEPSLISDFDVNVNLNLNRNLEFALAMPFLDDLGGIGAAVTRVDVSTRLGGALDVRMQGGEPTLVGVVDVIEGQVALLRSRFDMNSGTITFAGGDPATDANLDLDAEMAVSGASVDMRITGTPDAPDIDLSSDEYPDRTEQMTILLTGQAPEDLSAESGAAATQALAGVLFNSLLGGQSLGTFTVEPDGSVRVGVPVAPKVYAASTISPLTTDPNENTLSVEGEWQLAPRLVASGGIGDQVSWGDIFWEIRF